MVIQRISINATDWTPITATMRCNYWTVRCDDSDMKIRTNAADDVTEDTIKAGMQEGVTSAAAFGISADSPFRPYRYPSGQVLCYLQSVSGDRTVILQLVS
jgi:hypothetical protein